MRTASHSGRPLNIRVVRASPVANPHAPTESQKSFLPNRRRNPPMTIVAKSMVIFYEESLPLFLRTTAE
jgi:hypothetical protein